jgi:superfamily II DNA or RNA helicase
MAKLRYNHLADSVSVTGGVFMSKNFYMRPYQRNAVDALKSDFRKGVGSAIVVMPTGTGKTVVFSHAPVELQSKRTLVLAHRDSLIRQAAAKIYAVTGIMPEIEKAGERATVSRKRINNPTVVASVQTLCKPERLERFPQGEFDCVIIDEAHRAHQAAKTYSRIVDRFRESARIIGFTATPDRHDRIVTIGEGKFFERCAFEYLLPDAIFDAYLVPIKQKFIKVKGLSWKSVRMVRGDFDPKQIDEIVNQDSRLHAMSSPACELIEDGQSIVFCNSVAHATAINRVMSTYGRNSGAPFGSFREYCASISGRDETEVVDEVTKSFLSRRLQNLINCDLFTEGFDHDSIKSVVIMRPTKSRVKYAQMVGRGTRILSSLNIDQYAKVSERRDAIEASDKPYCSVIDFVGSGRELDLSMSVADILSKNKNPNPRVMNRVKKAVMDGDDRDIEEIEAEMERIEEQKRLRELYSWVAADKVSYEVEEIDPFRLAEELASPSQRKVLDAAGVEYDTMITKRQAGQRIAKIRGRPGSIEPYQIGILIRSGWRAEEARSLSFNEAMSFITRIRTGVKS